jgi:cytochrome c-type biogenesis protein CcmH
VRRLLACLIACGAVLATAAPVAVGVHPRASLLDIEDEVMCPVCGVTLNLAQDAPSANDERALIRRLIAQGDTKQQIKDRLVAEFGPAILAEPEKKGFDLAAYLVPLGALAAAVIALAFALPRWRRRARPAATAPAQADISPADAQRLEDDLTRHDV